MKKVAFTTLILFAFQVSRGQTFNEWFKQKKTQKKYLIEQIAALKIYLGYGRQGYSIARNGLTTIGNIKRGDFKLHNDFFSSLSRVNPRIKIYSNVRDIVGFQIKILQAYKSTSKYLQSVSLYTPAEIDFIQRVFTNLIDNCDEDLNDLIAIITTNESQMKDDERVKRIDAIYDSMEDKYAFTRSFGDEAKVLFVQKVTGKNIVETFRRLYGIKN